MARYGQSFKNRAVARSLPPESAALEEVAREIAVEGVPVGLSIIAPRESDLGLLNWVAREIMEADGRR